MNEKRSVLIFNIVFLLLLMVATYFYQKKHRPAEVTTGLRPINVLADVTKDTSTHKVFILPKLPSVIRVIAKDNTTVEISDYTTSTNLVNSSGQQFALSDFFQKLLELKKKKRKKIRIAYFGDSMIEGDLITQELRDEMQDYFGGSGVGFVPLTSIVAGFRRTVGHSFSDDWTDVSFKSDSKSGADLFISGHSFFGNPNSWVDYKTVNQPHLDNFSDISILYGMPESGKSTTAVLTYNGKQQLISATSSFNKFDIRYDSSNEFKLSVSSSDIPFYGAAFESDSGLFIDNFSFRGISGVEFKYFTEDFLKQIQKTRPYDLLIFHYGPNLLFRPDLTDFGWYEKIMLPVLKKMRAAFPETSILLISTADKGANYDGTWHTSKGVLPLIDVQYDMAQNINADFFNLYNAMGGEDAMVDWVQGDTAYANKDYTHVNFRGGKRLGKIIYNAFMTEYYDFEKHTDK
jgi:hypothetical protein